MEKKVWTKEEDEILIKGVSSKTNAELEGELGCRYPTINKRFKELRMWGERLEFSRKRRSNGHKRGNMSEIKINKYKLSNSYFITRTNKESRNHFLSNLKTNYKYDVRRGSKVVFVTNATKTSWKMERRLRNEFPDWTLKDIRHLSTINNI